MSVCKVERYPTCNFCSKEARYDAPMVGRSTWAYMCPDCWSERGSHTCYTKFELKSANAMIRDDLGTQVYDPELEATFMADLDLEEVMREELFGDSAGVTVADGCIVEPDGKCCHGYSSPLLLGGFM